MINIAAGRAKLAELVKIDELEVYPSSLLTGAAPPFVAVGMPRLTPRVGPCLDRSEWPIAVVMPQDGSTTADPVVQLDDLWPQVWDRLDAAITADPYLDGVCEGAQLERAEFGAFRVQGHEYPAQVIFINLDG